MVVVCSSTFKSTVEKHAPASFRIEWYRCMGEMKDMEHYVLRCGSVVGEKDAVEE